MESNSQHLKENYEDIYGIPGHKLQQPLGNAHVKLQRVLVDGLNVMDLVFAKKMCGTQTTQDT